MILTWLDYVLAALALAFGISFWLLRRDARTRFAWYREELRKALDELRGRK